MTGEPETMTIFAVRHITTYCYRRKVHFGEHRLMFRPRDSYDQRLLTESLVASPSPSDIRWVHDVFGNCVALVRFDKPARELRLETNITLEHVADISLDLTIDEDARHYPFSYDPLELPDIQPLMQRQCPDPQGVLEHWARQFVKVGHPTDTGHLLMTMCYAIRESFVYQRRSGRGIQLPIETLELRSGTCRDFALLMIEAARALGLPARFVSGYIYVPDRDADQVTASDDAVGRVELDPAGARQVNLAPGVCRAAAAVG